jgi:hypothetical protein
MDGKLDRLVRRRDALQEQLREAEDATAYTRILIDIACANRELTAIIDQPVQRSLGFLGRLAENQEGRAGEEAVR